ncbi:N amino acid transport system protein [Golovinomyces cichoracearum]|uniref:N amino acid transport system protein n=1 Tax=Golovinomyces cichoracearum TaxID=62708 RepID=A0A420H9K5_9PEZI|nr:N amino acid transport system protein [Golovinomyces cichoracearum]
MASYNDNHTPIKEKEMSFSGSGPFIDKLESGEIGEVMDVSDLEKRQAEGADNRFNRLGWKRLTVVLLVEAVALGSLSIPSAFAALGLVAGIIICIFVGIVAIYTSYVIGQVKLAYPDVSHYADAGRLLMGKFGYELVGAMFVLELVSMVGSHSLTGAIAFGNLTNQGTCSIVFSVISAGILFLLAIPPSFSEVAILGYIDFASIVLAIGVTVIGTGITWAKIDPATTIVSTWSYWPKENLSFVEAFIALGNIVFAYCFAICQFSFMDEMHTPKDYVKSIWVLGAIEIIIYTVTGAIVFVFVGTDVQSPALLSAGPVLSRVAFGLALPVIFISGSINITVVGRYVHGRIYKDSPNRFINTKQGWISWLTMISVITLIAWIIAESVPFFSDLISIISCLFVSGFTFYLPAWMWFKLVKKGSWLSTKNLLLTFVNGSIFAIGILILVGGTYSSIQDIFHQYEIGNVGKAFSCAGPRSAH